MLVLNGPRERTINLCCKTAQLVCVLHKVCVEMDGSLVSDDSTVKFTQCKLTVTFINLIEMQVVEVMVWLLGWWHHWPQTRQEHSYNIHHTVTHAVIECTFCVLKARWLQTCSCIWPNIWSWSWWTTWEDRPLSYSPLSPMHIHLFCLCNMSSVCYACQVRCVKRYNICDSDNLCGTLDP